MVAVEMALEIQRLHQTEQQTLVVVVVQTQQVVLLFVRQVQVDQAS
jgi:hypothetical protein